MHWGLRAARPGPHPPLEPDPQVSLAQPRGRWQIVADPGLGFLDAPRGGDELGICPVVLPGLPPPQAWLRPHRPGVNRPRCPLGRRGASPRRGRPGSPAARPVFAQVPWTDRPGAWGAWAARGVPQGARPGSRSGLLSPWQPQQLPARARGQWSDVSRLGGRLAPPGVATGPRLLNGQSGPCPSATCGGRTAPGSIDRAAVREHGVMARGASEPPPSFWSWGGWGAGGGKGGCARSCRRGFGPELPGF